MSVLTNDEKTLEHLGYTQELNRGMSAFSNFAISFSTICILAGGVTSFHLGLSGVGGAAFGLGWPLGCLYALVVAATMGQVASAFPTAGGIYHWASILGGRGWGWITAWFNLLGLVSAIAAIDLGTFSFTLGYLTPSLGLDWNALPFAARCAIQFFSVALLVFSQGYINHKGIRLTALLIDFSGYWILFLAVVLTAALLLFTRHWDFARLVTFSNFRGSAGGGVWPHSSNLIYLLLLSLLLPAYTVSGFDASAHAAEETVDAAEAVPKGILQSVWVSALAGWLFVCAIALAAPDLDVVAAKGTGAVPYIFQKTFPAPLCLFFFFGLSLAQYLCGLAAVTSTSRMVYAFARDGGLPSSFKKVSNRTPIVAIWVTVVAALLFMVYTPVYETMAAACAIFLYLSYVLPTLLGFFAYKKTWTKMGPWDLGKGYRPLAFLAVTGCVALILIGIQPPNEKNTLIVGGMTLVLLLLWFTVEKRRFPGPPHQSSAH